MTCCTLTIRVRHRTVTIGPQAQLVVSALTERPPRDQVSTHAGPQGVPAEVLVLVVLVVVVVVDRMSVVVVEIVHVVAVLNGLMAAVSAVLVVVLSMFGVGVSAHGGLLVSSRRFREVHLTTPGPQAATPPIR